MLSTKQDTQLYYMHVASDLVTLPAVDHRVAAAKSMPDSTPFLPILSVPMGRGMFNPRSCSVGEGALLDGETSPETPGTGDVPSDKK